MWNGKTVTVRALLLAASMTLIGGCELGATPNRAASDAASDQALSARYRVDAARNRVWVLTGEGVFVYDVSRPERVAVPLPGWTWIGGRYGCLPDLALGPRGEAVITSDIVPTLWRIDPDTLTASAHPLALDADTDKDVGFSALVYSPPHGAFLAASYLHGSLWRVDPSRGTAQKIPLSGPIPQACGLTLRPRSYQTLSRPADACAHTARGGWSVRFSPNGRSAYVSAAPCTEGS